MSSPLLFIAVLDLIRRKTVVKDAMKKLLYADDLALVTNGKQELQETMEEWNGLFIKHGLILNLEKTEVLHIGHQYGAPFSHLFTELKISPIEVHISAIQLQISSNRLNCRYLQMNCRYLQMNCRYLQMNCRYLQFN